MHLGTKGLAGQALQTPQPQGNTVVSEPARSPSGWRQPAGWTSGKLSSRHPPPPSFYGLTSIAGQEQGSETEHGAPRSGALSLLAPPRLSEGLDPHQRAACPWTPWPYLIGLESARAGSSPLISCPRTSGSMQVSLSAFAPATVRKLFVHFSPCLERIPADGRYCHHPCSTDEKA